MAHDQTRSLGVEPLTINLVDVEAPFCPHAPRGWQREKSRTLTYEINRNQQLKSVKLHLEISHAYFNAGNPPEIEKILKSRPTLLFERYYADKKPRSFFACSVHRDRKGCSFFHWADEKITDAKREKWIATFKESQPVLDRPKFQSSLERMLSLPVEKRYYCYNCNVLYDDSECSHHSTHDSEKDVCKEKISQPTRLLCPIDNRKSQAQFYFSDSALSLFTNELTRLKFSHVLCVGTPRLHEVLSASGTIQSLLLDIDNRYAQFFTPDKFQRFNMFTSYFYEELGSEICEQFLSPPFGEVAIVVDPPFGGLAKVLAVGLESLWKMARKELTTFLVFPYFMESHIVTALPSLWMMDYQVTYDNHKHFSSGAKPSPVRIYTNLPSPGMELPAADGYRLCLPCNRFVAKDNLHCDICSCCSSKDGRKYIHCYSCEQCVKPGRVHCATCNKCELPEHKCGTRGNAGCHVCGSLEHKRRDCPNKESSSKTKPQKRKKTSSSSSTKVKRRKK